MEKLGYKLMSVSDSLVLVSDSLVSASDSLMSASDSLMSANLSPTLMKVFQTRPNSGRYLL
jgi:hypothetical protein